jgi:hypothetical protein
MKRTDDELLALAAKAGGIDASKPWNAKTNSGDALELAVKLRMTIEVERDHVRVIGEDFGSVYALTGVSPVADVRNAIVECAAATGENMP